MSAVAIFYLGPVLSIWSTCWFELQIDTFDVLELKVQDVDWLWALSLKNGLLRVDFVEARLLMIEEWVPIDPEPYLSFGGKLLKLGLIMIICIL